MGGVAKQVSDFQCPEKSEYRRTGIWPALDYLSWTPIVKVLSFTSN